MTAAINFEHIVARCGGQREAFEELCCQLARLAKPEGSTFVRLRGSGGDGGVECFVDLADGSRFGWQAKFVFDIEGLLEQLTASLETALRIHAKLVRYVVCFPFDLTGPTGRKGRSQIEKFADWRTASEAAARASGRDLTIEEWPASRLLSEILKNDPQGGLRSYFFDATVFSENWFKQHLESVVLVAGPRYTPHPTVKTDLWKWFSAFGHTEEWSEAFTALLQQLGKEVETLQRMIQSRGQSPMDPEWPEPLRAKGSSCAAHLKTIEATGSELLTTKSRERATGYLNALDQCRGELQELEAGLRADLETRHGQGSAESPGFRQFMAEYEVSFPAANLDTVHDVAKALDSLAEWLDSPEGWPAFESTFLVTGIAGSGKTHGACDAAVKRLQQGRLSIVTFGHNFGGQPDPWTRVREYLGVPGTLGRDGLLDALNAAAEASGHILIIWLDAINETKPIRYWRDHLRSFADAISRRPFLRLCVTCRTSFASHSVPDGASWYQAEHVGFAGIEREACQAFFEHYHLDPPIFPILQPELANPLYLSLICKTLRAKGLKSLPAGWLGLAPAIQAFLSEKNHAFAMEHDVSEGAAIVPKALAAIAREIARLGETALTWSEADKVVRHSVAISAGLRLLDWLVRGDLLIEDAPKPSASFDSESVVRPAFERLGDFLVAQELLSGMDLSGLRPACQAGGRLSPYLGSQHGIANAEGVVSALSILIPEQFARGTELPDLLGAGPIRIAVLKIAVSSYLWRDPSSFTSASEGNLKEALGMRGLAQIAADALLSLCSQSSLIDANWLHTFLASQPMAIRDAFWCGYLHRSFEERGVVRRLIDAALELPIAGLETAVAERWAIVLLWFTAAADRRVKDYATRAAVAVVQDHVGVLAKVLRQMIEVDDGAIQERMLLVAYGVCLLRRDRHVLEAVSDALATFVAKSPSRFHNALIRDHARSIAELAEKLGVTGRQSELLKLLDELKSPWPLDLATDAQIKEWDALPKLVHSCLDDDFFVYSMDCLDEWTNTVSKMDMAKWILRRVVEGFRYFKSGCEGYDRYMLKTYGPGRAKPTWAERIGKKYQWIAMFELAARLSDHVVRERNSWEPELLRKPLILLEERQLDPTLPRSIIERQRGVDGWWFPALVQLVAPTEHGGKQWRLLDGYQTWDNRPNDNRLSSRYRQLWIHVNGFLVDEEECENVFRGLAGRNLFGRWMPEGASWLYGFAGEYPWGAAFNTDPEWYHGRARDDSGLPGNVTPVSVQLAAEWQYDASLPENRYFSVPTRIFFEQGDLWWNGQDGFIGANGETVLRAPELTTPGPSALIANLDELSQRLKRIRKRLIWTLLGEKLILGGRQDQRSPRRTFSQIAMLNPDGSIKATSLTFFDDYKKDTGFKQGTVSPEEAN